MSPCWSSTLTRWPLIIIGILLAPRAPLFAACQVITANNMGINVWDSASDWDLNRVPTACDDVVIPTGIPIEITGTDAQARSVTVGGQLTFASNSDTELSIGTGTVRVTNGGSIQMGQVGVPIQANVAAILDLGVGSVAGLIIDDGGLFYTNGAAKTPFTRATQILGAGTDSVDVEDLTGWNDGDVVTLSATDATNPYENHTESATITAILGTTFGFNHLSNYDHSNENNLFYVTNLTRNVVIRSSSSVFGQRGSILNNDTGGDGFLVTNTQFINLGNNASNQNGVVFTAAAGGVVSSCTFRDSTNGLYLAGSSGGEFTGNIFFNNAFYGVYASTGGVNNVFTGNHAMLSLGGFNVNQDSATFINNAAYSTLGSGITLIGAHFARLAGNSLFSNFSDGVYALGGSSHTISDGVYDYNTGHGIYFDQGTDHSVHNNTINNNALDGVVLAGTTRASVYDNTIATNSGSGIFGDTALHSSLAHNQISNNAYGLTLGNSSSGTVVAQNTFTNNAGGIFADNLRDVAFTENTFSKDTVSGVGISISNQSKRVLVATNTITGYAKGIYIAASRQVTVASNRISGANDRGVHLSGADQVTLSSNTIDGSTGNYGVFVAGSPNTVLVGNTICGHTIAATSWENGGGVTFSTGGVLADNALGYRPNGTSLPDHSELYFYGTEAKSVVMKNNRVNIASLDAIDMNQNANESMSLLSYEQNLETGTARIYGTYNVSASTLTLDYAMRLHGSSSTSPRQIHGTSIGSIAVTPIDSAAITQLVTLAYLTSDNLWHVVGSESGEMCTVAASGGTTNCPTVTPQFSLTFSATGALQGDAADFVLIAASNDQNKPKHLVFGFTVGTPRLNVASNGGFVLRGAAGQPSTMDWEGLQYYMFVDSGAFTCAFSSITNTDVNGIWLSGNAGVVMASSTFDYSGSSGAYITAHDLTSVGIFYGVEFANSRTDGTPLNNVRVSGTDSNLDWTFEYKGARSGSSYESDPHGKVAWLNEPADTAPPVFSNERSVSKHGLLLAENQWNDLTAGVTVQVTVQDAGAGLAAPRSTYPSRSSTLAYWPLSDTANPVDDIAGSYDGTASNTQFAVAGQVGNAMGFNGTNSYVDLPDMNFDYSTGFSIEAWVYYNSFTQTWSRILDLSNGMASNNIIFGHETNTRNLAFEIYSGASATGILHANNVLQANVWMHLAVTVDAGGVGRLYKNGKQVATASVGLPSNLNRTVNYIGRSPWPADGYFNGKIDELRLVNRALSAREIASDASGAYSVTYSTDAGASWNPIISTDSSRLPYVQLSGSNGDTTPQTLSIYGLTLARSTTSTVCAGVSPCGATNQVEFFAEDLLQNGTFYGPYAVLAASATYPNFFVTAVTSDSITATWDLVPGATGYTMVVSSYPDLPPINVLGSSIATTNAGTVGGLFGANTVHWVFVQANRAGYSTDFEIPASTITLPTTPADAAFVNVTDHGFDVAWTLNGGPGTHYEVTAATEPIPGANVTATILSTGSPVSYSALDANTTYYATVRELGFAQPPSGYAQMGSTITLASPPIPLVLTGADISPTRVDPHWVAYNPFGTNYTVQLSSVSDFSGSITMTDTIYSSTSFTGLTPGVTYYMRVRAVNYGGVPTVWRPLGPRPPIGVSAPSGVIVEVTTDTITASWDLSEGATSYRLIAATETVAASLITAATSATLEGLRRGTTYVVLIQACGGVSCTDPTVLAATRTLGGYPPSVPSNFVGTYGNSDTQVTFTLDYIFTYDNGITIPVGTQIAYQMRTSSSPLIPSENWTPAGTYVSLAGSSSPPIFFGPINVAATPADIVYYHLCTIVDDIESVTCTPIASNAPKSSNLKADYLIPDATHAGYASVPPTTTLIDGTVGLSLTLIAPNGTDVVAAAQLHAFHTSDNSSVDPYSVPGARLVLPAPGISLEQDFGVHAGAVIYVAQIFQGSAWSNVGAATYNPATKLMTLSAAQTGTYRVVRALTFSGNAGSGIHAYPVPFRPLNGDTAITFTNLPVDGVEIQVTTLANEEVFSTHVNGATSYAWDAKNGSGNVISSGLYLYTVRGSGVEHHGKLMVTR